MPRYPRAFLTGYPHHVLQRGHNRRPVFLRDDDYHLYLSNLGEQTVRFGIGLVGYCLMTNHVHLLLQPERDGHDISRLMRVLAARQTRHTNRVRKRTGTLWESRFKSSIVDTDAYLLACCRYIELNPVRAGIAATPGEYPWSSYRLRTDPAVSGPMLVEPANFASLGRSLAERQDRYREYVAAGCSRDELRTIGAAANRNQLTGSEGFKLRVEHALARRIVDRTPGRPRRQHDASANS